MNEDITLASKVRLLLIAPLLFAGMFLALIVGFLSMEVRNIGRWLNLFGEKMVGSWTLYKDLWPMTVGALWADYKRYFGIGS